MSYNSQPRLFKVNPPAEGSLYFTSKKKAKRDELRKSELYLVVMRGPDHRLGETFNKSTKTRSSKRRSTW